MKNIFTIAILALSINAFAQVPSYVPTNGLVSWYPFTGNANDLSGNNNNGTVNGATLTTDRFGNANSAYSFTNNSISFSNSNFAAFGSNSFSCSVWVKYTNPGNSLGNFVRYGNGVNGAGWGMRYTGDGKINCLEYSVTNNNITSSATYNDNNWHNIIFIKDVNNLSVILYIDGVLINTVPMMSSYINNISIGLPFNIGTANGYESFIGSLDDIGIWDRVLTQSEIIGIYNSNDNVCLPSYVPTNGLIGWWPFCGNANDESGNLHDGTVNGAILSQDRFGYSNKAYQLNGNENIIISDTSVGAVGKNSFTASCWFKTNSKSGYSNIIRYGDCWYSSGWGVRLYNGLVNCLAYDSNEGNKYDLYNQQTSFSDNNWHNIIFIRDVSIMKFFVYVDNQLLIDTSFSVINNLTNAGAVGFGSCNAGIFEFFNGSIDDIGIWNRALTNQEISNLFNSTTTGINYNIHSNSINVFPNPSNGIITINIDSKTMNGVSLIIKNLLGQIVYTTPINAQQTTVNLSTWTGNGIYFVHLIDASSNTIDIRKIVLQ